jgi:hypothetical protein
MAITINEEGDGRNNLGMSGILQWAGASFSVSDYPPGGYPNYPSQFGLSHIRGIMPMGYGAAGAGFPGGYVWEYVKPAVAGPAASNPGFLVALEQSGVTGSLVPVTGSNSNFAGANLDLLAYGW